jgi:hypothetical protein
MPLPRQSVISACYLFEDFQWQRCRTGTEIE